MERTTPRSGRFQRSINKFILHLETDTFISIMLKFANEILFFNNDLLNLFLFCMIFILYKNLFAVFICMYNSLYLFVKLCLPKNRTDLHSSNQSIYKLIYLLWSLMIFIMISINPNLILFSSLFLNS